MLFVNNTYGGSDMRRAFTLLELIICITVLLTLLAILLPVFFQIKKDTNKITTLSNIKQLGFAWRMYISDYDDTLMRAVVLGNHWWGDNKGKAMLSPYINLSSLSDPSLKYYNFDNTYNFSGYGYNSYVSPVDSKNNPIPVLYSQISEPTETVAFGTAAGLFNVNNSYVLYPVSTLTSPNWYFPTFHGRYNGFGIICWADGHTSIMKAKNFSHNIEYKKKNLGEIDKDNNPFTIEYFDL